MRIYRRVKSGCATFCELIKAIWLGPNWWLVPVILILVPAAGLLVFLQYAQVVAPFVYTVF